MASKAYIQEAEEEKKDAEERRWRRIRPQQRTLYSPIGVWYGAAREPRKKEREREARKYTQAKGESGR